MEQILRRQAWQIIDKHQVAALQDAENGHCGQGFVRGVRAKCPGGRAELRPEWAFENGHAVEAGGQDGQAHHGGGLVGGVISQAQGSGHGMGGFIDSEKGQQAQPLARGKTSQAGKAAGQGVEGVAAAGAAHPAFGQGVRPAPPAPGTHGLTIWPALPFQELAGTLLRADVARQIKGHGSGTSSRRWPTCPGIWTCPRD